MPRAYPRHPSQNDPRLNTAAYKALRTQWQAYIRATNAAGGAVYCQAGVCLLPNIPIRVDGPRTPAHLDVGHITPRILDPRTTWTMEDTRPEHARCNRTAGTNLANQRIKQRKAQNGRTPLTINLNDW